MSPAPLSRRALLQAAVGAASVGLCGGLDQILGRSARAAPRAAPRARMVARVERDCGRLDPAFRSGAIEANVLRAICPGLVRFRGDSLELEEDAASRIRQETPTRIAFVLRPGIAFSGGFGELDADDVKFSLERIASASGSLHAADLAALDGVEVRDHLSGYLHLKHPAPAFWRVGLASASGCLVSRRAADARGEEFVLHSHGGGPYRLHDWVRDERLVLRANRSWTRGATRSGQRLAEVVLRPLSEAHAVDAFRAGEIDFTALAASAVAAIADDPAARLIQRDSIHAVWLGINVERPPFRDLRVRQAIRAALDVEAILAEAYRAHAPRAHALIAPGLAGHWDAAPRRTRDLAAARALLASAGHGGGLRVRLALEERPPMRAVAQIAQRSLAEVGVALVLDVQSPEAFAALAHGARGAELELFLRRRSGSVDPSGLTRDFVSSQVGAANWQRWQNAEFDRLDAQAASMLDAAARAQLYVRMQQLLEESSACTWITHEASLFATRRWLEPAVLPTGEDWQLGEFRES